MNVVRTAFLLALRASEIGWSHHTAPGASVRVIYEEHIVSHGDQSHEVWCAHFSSQQVRGIIAGRHFLS